MENVDTGEDFDSSNDLTEVEIDNLSDEELDREYRRTLGEDVEEKSPEETPESTNEEIAESPEGEVLAEPSKEVAVDSQQEVIKLRANLEQQERYIQQRATEIGLLRKENHELSLRLEEAAKDLELDNPREAAKIDRRVEELRAESEQLEGEERSLKKKAVLMATLPKFLSKDQLNLASIERELLEEDGLSPEEARSFTGRLFEQEPAMVINIAKRAHYGDVLRKALPELLELRQKVAQLEGKVKKGGDTMAEVIKRSSSTPKLLKAAPSKELASELSDEDISNLSKAELDAYLDKYTKLG